jgi:hypothetical protein
MGSMCGDGTYTGARRVRSMISPNVKMSRIGGS